jgi:micrococcal nuclease
MDPHRRSRRRVTAVAPVLLLVLGCLPTGPTTPKPADGRPSTTSAPPAPAGTASQKRPPGVPADAEPMIVVRVVDGDTIRVVAEPDSSVEAGGSIRVRLLNVDAPEVGRDGAPDECGAAQASRLVESMLAPGDLVWAAADLEDRDVHDRPLRAVWTAEGDFVNERLVADGWAVAVLFPPNERFHAVMVAAERRARAAGVGVWSLDCR